MIRRLSAWCAFSLLVLGLFAGLAHAQADDTRIKDPKDPPSVRQPKQWVGDAEAVPLLEDAPAPRRRRRLGGSLSRETIPEPWVLVPHRYEAGSRALFLHVLGYIKLDGMHDFEVNGLGVGFPNEFLPSQIPPRGSPDAARKGRSGVTVNSSRLELGVHTPTVLGNAGALLDFNFMGNISGRPAFLLRQLYLEVGDLRFGKSWTTFINVDAIPDTLDYEGANSLPEARQPLLRWTQPLGVGPLHGKPIWKELSWVVAAEQPDAQLTLQPGTNVRNKVPDFVMNLEWQRGGSSVWLSGIYRRLEARGNGIEAAKNGWGIQLTGNLEFDPWPYIQFGVIHGKGLARYFNDTMGLGLDGMVTPQGKLKLFSATGAWVGIQHWWIAPLRSTVSYGYLRIGDDALQPLPGDTNGIFHESHYASANLIYSPIPPLDIGIEYLFGYRRTTDGRSGIDNRIQVSLILHFASGRAARSDRSLLDRLLGRE